MRTKFSERRKKIIELHKKGLSIQEIKIQTNTHPSVIKRLIERNRCEENVGFFNINKHDCWIMPTTYQVDY